jgi:hypothetical protein
MKNWQIKILDFNSLFKKRINILILLFLGFSLLYIKEITDTYEYSWNLVRLTFTLRLLTFSLQYLAKTVESTK